MLGFFSSLTFSKILSGKPSGKEFMLQIETDFNKIAVNDLKFRTIFAVKFNFSYLSVDSPNICQKPDQTVPPKYLNIQI